MIRLFEKFKKPLTDADLDNMTMGSIMDTCRRIDDNGTIVSNPSKSYLESKIAARVKALVEAKLDGKEITVEKSCTIIFSDKDHNKKAGEFMDENKMNEMTGYEFGQLTDWLRPNICWSKIFPNYELRPYGNSTTVTEFADGLAEKYKLAYRSLDELEKIAKSYSWLIPTVETLNVIYNQHADEWETESVVITPEQLDGFITAVKTVLEDEEANKWREYLLKQFSESADGNPKDIDFDKPKVRTKMPDEWKKEYHETIRPAEERRDKCRNVLDEIMKNITLLDVLQSAERRNALLDSYQKFSGLLR